MLGMSSRHRSQRTLSNGLWSTAKIKFSQHRTKKRALSKASATANASPSMGTYLGSAGCVKRLPTSVIFQPVRQQKGLTGVQSQCFWNNEYPMPCFDQSVAKQVGLDLSNIRTPFSISWMMAVFDSSKSFSRSCVQVNGDPGFSGSRQHVFSRGESVCHLIDKAKP